MWSEFNGFILSSKKKTLKFIAYKKYKNNILTQNINEYNDNECAISQYLLSISIMLGII